LLGQLQHAQAVRDRGPILADPLRQLFLRPTELGQELLIGLRGLDRIQILAQQIFDERDLDALRVGRVADDRGDSLETGLASSAPAALSRDQPKAVAVAPHDYPLDNDRGPYHGSTLVTP